MALREFSRFRSLIAQSASKVDGLVFVYDLNDVNSLNEFSTWTQQQYLGNIMKEIQLEKDKASPVMILANKIDLIDANGCQENNEELTSDQFKDLKAYAQGLKLAQVINGQY